MRLRTLPVSVAGVFCAWSFAIGDTSAKWIPGVLCLVFAVLAQISSNFANEYYDFMAGLDKSGRVGPRRGVTEGDISASAMKTATFATLMSACAIGCTLIIWGGFWLVAVGLAIAVGVLAYSTGPYPLSHHGLGEIAVIMFFGVIPVNLTYYLICGRWETDVLLASLAVGLMGSNVLIVNNYRDMDDDREVGKNTLCVLLGRKAMSTIYLLNGLIAAGLLSPTLIKLGNPGIVTGIVYLIVHTLLYVRLKKLSCLQLNPLLGQTALTMLALTIALVVLKIIYM